MDFQSLEECSKHVDGGGPNVRPALKNPARLGSLSLGKKAHPDRQGDLGRGGGRTGNNGTLTIRNGRGFSNCGINIQESGSGTRNDVKVGIR